MSIATKAINTIREILGARGSSSVMDALPAKAATKLDLLTSLRDDAFAISRTNSERQRETSAIYSNAADAFRRKYPADKRADPDDPAARALAFAKAERDRVSARCAESQVKCEQLGSLQSAITHWLEDLPRDARLDEASVAELADCKLPKNDLMGFVNAQRVEINHFTAELHRVACAPLTVAEAKKLMRARVAELAARGTPDVSPLIESGGAIEFPAIGRSIHYCADEVRNEFLSVLAWLDEDKLLTRLGAEIDAHGNEAEALSTEARAEQTAQLLAALLRAERAEEAGIEAFERSGATIIRRANADPRAVLGLASSLPRPRLN